ncbi:MAG: putative bifunctional diguanylate cyclase/phosphodiesterase [Actinomycetota bacterium]
MGPFGHLGELTADVTTVAPAAGTYTHVSAACRRVLGWEPEQMVGCRPDDFIHPDDVEPAADARRAAEGSRAAVISRHRIRRADGTYLWTESATRAVRMPSLGGQAVLIASVRDISDRMLAEARLERRALSDPLTGVANRTLFVDRLGHAVRRLGRVRSVLGVIYLDLDRFKVINDSLGHKAGDELLRKVAERIQRSLRPADTLARLGGDEFVVLAEGLLVPAEAERLAQRICATVREPFELGGESFVCTVSAGVTTTTDPGQSPGSLLQEADLALYRAKDSGRSRAEVFDEELRSTAVARLGTEQLLRVAIAAGNLEVHYQPVVDLSGGHVVGAEALVRVRTGDELVTAESFIAVAEEIGLVATIDAHVLARSLEQAASWRREPRGGPLVGVSVNVSARQLADAGFVATVEEVLTRTSLPRGSLGLEMSERVLMDASCSAMTGLNDIRALGVMVGLDDFGTGYSSLASLRRLPLDFVKIDRSFVHELGRSTQDAAVVAGVVDLSHALGLSVVAEGVETAHQRQILAELGCDQAQGFLFGAAVDPQAFAALIDRGQRPAQRVGDPGDPLPERTR